MSNTTMVNISGADTDTINGLQDTILKILGAEHADESTKQMALKVLSKGVEAPQYTTVSGCSMNTGDQNYRESSQKED